MNGIAQPAPMQPTVRLTVSLTEDRHAIVVRSIHQHQDAIADHALVLPVATAEVVARAILEQCSKASKIVIPQTPLG